MNLAERFNAVNQAQDRKDHTDKLQNMNMEQLGALTIKFGDTKVGQTYQTVVTEDPKYCRGFFASMRPARSQSMWSSSTFCPYGWIAKNWNWETVPRHQLPRRCPRPRLERQVGKL
jgi:hypothetical protein